MFTNLHWIDWCMIIGYIGFAMGLGLYHSRQSTQSITNYFASGRNMPWWILGTSLAATVFATDTPMAVSSLVIRRGIAGNWFGWNYAIIAVFGVFFFVRYWRRANILTDVEFIELRYSGKPGTVLRGFKALYFGIVWNGIIIGWVNLAMAKIIMVTLGLPDTLETKFWSVMFCFFITFIYTAIAGLSGVMVTDVMQFVLSLSVSIMVAVLGVYSLGGMENMLLQLKTIYGEGHETAMVALTPIGVENPLLPVSWFLIYIGLFWWASGNTDAGGYYAQRMISARNERHALFGYLWTNIARYCFVVWPWVIAGLVAAVKYPYLPDPVTGAMPDAELSYVKLMISVLPVGVLGLGLAGFFAAYMSTVDTHMNWGASYLVNDFYQRFIKKDGSEKHYVYAGIVATGFIALVGAVITFLMHTIIGGWEIMAQILVGAGLVHILRWFWWRVNAWSEFASLASGLFMTLFYAIL